MPVLGDGSPQSHSAGCARQANARDDSHFISKSALREAHTTCHPERVAVGAKDPLPTERVSCFGRESFAPHPTARSG